MKLNGGTVSADVRSKWQINQNIPSNIVIPVGMQGIACWVDRDLTLYRPDRRWRYTLQSIRFSPSP